VRRCLDKAVPIRGGARKTCRCVGIIGSDKTKTQTYCQIHDLSEELLQAVQEKDRKKANALAGKIAELNKKMGPEFAALIDIEKRVDLNSPDGQEIASIAASLGESCGER
jgi:ferritin-like protein